MLAFFKLQKDSMVEYYKNINYLISLGNQFKINDPQLQVIWDRLKKVYPAVIEKNPDFRFGLTSRVRFFLFFKKYIYLIHKQVANKKKELYVKLFIFLLFTSFEQSKIYLKFLNFLLIISKICFFSFNNRSWCLGYKGFITKF